MQQTSYASQSLTQAFNLTPEDIAANRSGVLSPKQQERFHAMLAQGQKSGLLAIGAVLLLTAGIVAWQFVTDGEMAQSLKTAFDQAPGVLIAGVGGSLLLFVIIGVISMLRMGNVKNRTLKVDSVSGKVKLNALKADGEAATVARMAGISTRTFVIQIGRTKIYTTEESQWTAFQNGGSYRVYYVKVSSMPMLISAEIV